jgi:hypothetical protein
MTLQSDLPGGKQFTMTLIATKRTTTKTTPSGGVLGAMRASEATA